MIELHHADAIGLQASRSKRPRPSALALGVKAALALANDAVRLRDTPADALQIALRLVVKALAPFDDERRVLSPSQAACIAELDAAGRAIAAELSRRTAQNHAGATQASADMAT